MYIYIYTYVYTHVSINIYMYTYTYIQARDKSFIKAEVDHWLPMSPPRFLSWSFLLHLRRSSFHTLRPFNIVKPKGCKNYSAESPTISIRNCFVNIARASITPPSFSTACTEIFRLRIHTDKNFLHCNGENDPCPLPHLAIRRVASTSP